MGINVKASNVMFSNQYITVKEDDIVLSLNYDEQRKTEIFDKKYSYVESPDFVVVIVSNSKNEYLISTQYRHPLKRQCNEFVCGMIDDNEDPKLAALRELKEEGGLDATNAEFIGIVYPLAGQNTCAGYIYYVNSFEELGVNELEDYEKFCKLKVDWVSYKKLKQMIYDGEFSGGVSLSALAMFETKHEYED